MTSTSHHCGCSCKQHELFMSIFRETFHNSEPTGDELERFERIKIDLEDWPAKTFEFMSKVTGVHIGVNDKDGTPTNFHGSQKFARVHSPFWSADLAKRTCCTRLVKFKFMMDMTQCFYIAIIMAFTLLRDYMIDYGRPRLSDEADLADVYGNCAIKSKTYHVNYDRLNELTWVDNMLEQMILIKHCTGLNIYNYWATLIALLGLHWLSLHIKQPNLRCDFLTFAFNPSVEVANCRQLIKDEMDFLKTASFQGKHKYFNVFQFDADNDTTNKLTIRFKERLRDMQAVGKTRPTLDMVHRRKLLWPAYMTSSFLEQQLKYIKGAYFVMGFSVIITFVSLTIQTILLELYKRSSLRLELLTCKLWNSDSVYIQEFTSLPEFTSDWQLNLYTEHFNHTKITILDKVKLGVLVELPLMGNMWLWVLLLNGYTAVITNDMGYWLGIIVYVWLNNMYNLWLRQIEGQCKTLMRLLDLHESIHINYKDTSSLTSTTTIDTSTPMRGRKHSARYFYERYQRDKRRQLILLAMATTYTNQELFRKSFHRMKIYLDAVTTVGIVAALNTVGVLALVSKLTIKDWFVLFLNKILIINEGFLFVLGDLLILYRQLTENQVRKISRLSTMVAARLYACKLSNNSMSYLWQRGLISEERIRQQYSPTILGAKIAKRDLIKLNLYAFIISHLLYFQSLD